MYIFFLALISLQFTNYTQLINDRRHRRLYDEEQIIKVEFRRDKSPEQNSGIKTAKPKAANFRINKHKTVSGQAILSLFGKWLFEAINVEVVLRV